LYDRNVALLSHQSIGRSVGLMSECSTTVAVFDNAIDRIQNATKQTEHNECQRSIVDTVATLVDVLLLKCHAHRFGIFLNGLSFEEKIGKFLCPISTKRRKYFREKKFSLFYK